MARVKKPKEPKVPESVIQSQILRYLEHHERDGRLSFWRLPLGGVKHGGIRKVSPMRGFPDIFGVIAPTGRLFALEVKTKDGKLSEVQEATLVRLREMGARAEVVRSLEEAIKVIHQELGIMSPLNQIEEPIMWMTTKLGRG